jgi:hypothetical protein
MQTPPVSGSSPLPRALSLALCAVGPTCWHQFPLPVCSLSVSWARFASAESLAPLVSFSLCAVGLPCQFHLPRPRRGPARAHSHTWPDFLATTPAHVPSSLFRAPPMPRTHPSPHFAQPPLSRALPTPPAAVGDPHPHSRSFSLPETTPGLTELHLEVRHPSPCPISLIAPCVHPISPSPVLDRSGPPCSRGGRPI